MDPTFCVTKDLNGKSIIKNANHDLQISINNITHANVGP